MHTWALCRVILEQFALCLCGVHHGVVCLWAARACAGPSIKGGPQWASVAELALVAIYGKWVKVKVGVAASSSPGAPLAPM